MRFLIRIFTVILACIFVQAGTRNSTQFFLQKSLGTDPEALLAVSFEKSEEDTFVLCDLFTHEDQIGEVLKTTKDLPVRTVSEAELEKRLGNCSVILEVQGPHEDYETASGDSTEYAGTAYKQRRNSNTEVNTTVFEERPGYLGFLIPLLGTKWCGDGYIAKHYDDLGSNQDTDRCCRAHDLCNDTLGPGETRNNLKNTSPFTKLNCKCDQDFYNCLKGVNSYASNLVGRLYFNVLWRTCYTEDYPINKNRCKKYTKIFNIKLRCKEYERNTTAPKVYQWSSSKWY